MQLDAGGEASGLAKRATFLIPAYCAALSGDHGAARQVLDVARDKLSVIAPGADLIYANAFERLTEGLTSAFIVGEAVIDGVRCDHIAFRNAEVDWQIWIQQGDKPVPRKFVITSKRMPGSPQFVSVMSNWQTASAIPDATFSFVPPKGAQKIDFLPVAPAVPNK